MREKKWFDELLKALDGHTAASLAEAEEALSGGLKSFDDFAAEVKRSINPQGNRTKEDK